MRTGVLDHLGDSGHICVLAVGAIFPRVAILAAELAEHLGPAIGEGSDKLAAFDDKQILHVQTVAAVFRHRDR
jgi:hypothetical protein